MSNLYRNFTYPKDVDIIQSEIVYKGYYQMKRYQFRYRLFENGWSSPVNREIFERGQAVGVVLHDPKRDQVVLIEQFRIGALRDRQSPWLLEIVAGVVNEGESPETVAVRETKEESGLDILAIKPICQYWSTPGACSEEIFLFYAEVDASKAFGIHGLDEENEDIRVYAINTQTAFEMVHLGSINNGLTIIGLQWLELNFKALNKTSSSISSSL
jgi:ADP-ribose pyrophosphatase